MINDDFSVPGVWGSPGILQVLMNEASQKSWQYYFHFTVPESETGKWSD